MRKLNVICAAIMAVCSASAVASASKDYTSEQLPVLSQEPQHLKATQRITSLFYRSHFKRFKLSDPLSEKILERYINNLDYSRLVLLQKDVDQFKAKYATKVDDALREGKLQFAYELFSDVQRKRFERFEYAIELLKTPMTFDGNERFEYDREELPWPKNQAELDALWQKKVKYDALSLKLTGKEWPKIQELLTKRYTNVQRRMTQTNSEDVYQILINSFARSIEAHTSYLSPRSADRFKQEMNLQLEGIGAVLQSNDDYTTIMRLVPGGPAARSEKLEPKDRIIAVAQDGEEFVDVVGWRLDEVVDLIKGPKGTKVRLQILGDIDAGDDVPAEITLVREKIHLEDKAAKGSVIEPIMSSLDHRIGVIEIPGFYIGLAEDVTKELAKLDEQNIDGLIIDLRGNGGGSLEEARLLTGLFIDEGPVVQVKTQRNRVLKHEDRDGKTYYNGTLTVLVDRYSASASEIFAAAIQDYGRGVIIGEQTFGKGTVQENKPIGRIFDLYDQKMGNVQYTIAKFYRVNGGSTQHKGVIPDISFPSPIDPAEWGESKEDNALPFDKIKAAKFDRVADLSSSIQQLDKQYKARVASDPEFAYVQEDIKEYKQVLAEKSLSLNENDRKNKQAKSKEKNLARINERLARLKLDAVKDADDAPEVLDDLDVYLEQAALITEDFIRLQQTAKTN